jgi:hypothetical protein
MVVRLEGEFLAVDVNEHNVFDVTFLKREAFVNDSVKFVERVGNNGRAVAEPIVH